MSLEFSNHLVAFIDLLGFSEMVKSDCESSDAPRYLELLHSAHLEATNSLSRNLDAGLIQFSDSIVFSRPYQRDELEDFLKVIGEFQKTLLLKHLLCRGGVTFGKHFVKEKFMFSKAMIDAYILEHTEAKYPRIVVSKDLLELVSPDVPLSSLPLKQEDDEVYFIDYLIPKDNPDKDNLKEAVNYIISKQDASPQSVKEKLRWLARYADFSIGTSLAKPSFRNV